MENSVIKRLILNFRKGDIAAFSDIYCEFKKMIEYYSRKIGDEDAKQELTAFLIEKLYEVELSLFSDNEGDNIKRYLAVSVRNKYIALSKAKQRDIQFLLFESDLRANDVYDAIFIKEMLEVLSKKQRKVIMYKYIYGYSDAEIAHAFGITRQAVNGLKNRAFDILKKLYS